MPDEPIEFLVLCPSGDGEGVFHITPYTRKGLEKFLSGEAIWENYRFLDQLPIENGKWADRWDLRDSDDEPITTYAIIRVPELVSPKIVDVVKKFEIPD